MAIVNTIYGDMDDSLLENKQGVQETEDGDVHFNEYYLKGELVHRSVHLYLKKGLDVFGQAASLT